MRGKALHSVVVALLLVALAGCTTSGKVVSSGKNYTTVVCADVKHLPQDLNAYAAKAGGASALLSGAEQAEQSIKAKHWFFYPWHVTTPSASKSNAFWAATRMKPTNAFTTNYAPFSESEWQNLIRNSNQAAYPAMLAKAITVCNTSLRGMPTQQPFFRNPSIPGEGFPFDYLQHTALWVGTPLVITHVSVDGRWYLAETRMAHGWIPAEDIAMVDEGFVQTWEAAPLVAITKDKVLLHTEGWFGATHAGKQGVQAHIGTLLPDAGNGVVLYPTRDRSAQVGIGRVALTPQVAQPYPLPLTPNSIAAVGNGMMGQAYGWGGLQENRDCSSMTRDLMLPFGIWLPRNSSQQGAWGSPVVLSGFSLDEKEATILASAKPFFSLIWLKGHIGLYLGAYNGKPVMFHNIWGIRTTESGSATEGRAVIGKAVVTTLRPGAELANVATPGSLLDRIERVSILPEADYKLPVVKNKPVRMLKGKKTPAIASKKAKAGSRKVPAKKKR